MSELFTGSITLKSVNILKIIYQGLSMFLLCRIPTMEEISFMHHGTCSCTHIRKTIPLVPIHLFTRQIIPSLYQQSLNEVLCNHAIILLFIHFHRTVFCGVVELAQTLEVFSNSIFVHSLVYPITRSFLNGFQPNLYQLFSACKSICERGYYTAG